MNTFTVLRLKTGEVTVKVLSPTNKTRDLNNEELFDLEGALSKAEFDQQLTQDSF